MAGREAITIFRAVDSPLRSEVGGGPYIETSPEETAGSARMLDAGVADGALVKVLYSMPGFSLVYVWFKANFPLVRHSHSNDCLYYIVSGDIRFGTEQLEPGDGFFVPGDVPYTYSVGKSGVELLEFRHSSFFETRNVGATSAFFDRAVRIVRENREAWQSTPPPPPARRRIVTLQQDSGRE